MSLRRFKKAHFFQLPPEWRTAVWLVLARRTRNLEDSQAQRLGDVVKKNLKISDHMSKRNESSSKTSMFRGHSLVFRVDN